MKCLLEVIWHRVGFSDQLYQIGRQHSHVRLLPILGSDLQLAFLEEGALLLHDVFFDIWLGDESIVDLELHFLGV